MYQSAQLKRDCAILPHSKGGAGGNLGRLESERIGCGGTLLTTLLNHVQRTYITAPVQYAPGQRAKTAGQGQAIFLLCVKGESGVATVEAARRHAH